MAFNEKEQEIIRWGTQNGKSRQEIMDAVTRLRTGVGPRQQEVTSVVETNPSYVEQVKEAAQGGIDKAKEGIDLTREGNTVDVARGVVKTGAGAVETISSPLAPLFKPIAEGFQKLTDFFGSTKFMQEAAEGLPEGGALEKSLDFASDLGEVAGFATGAKTVPKIAANTAKAATSGLSKGTEFLGNVTAKGTDGIKQATNSALDPSAIMQRVARVSKGKQAAFEELTGSSVGKYLVDRGIFGDVDEITQQLYKRFETSKGNVDKALDKLPGEYRSVPVGNALKQLAERERRISSPGAVSKDLERVNELLKKHAGVGLNMSEINEVKRLFERNVRLDYLKENVPDKVSQANNLDSAIRKFQFDKAQSLGFKNLGDLNKETQAAKQLLDDLGAEYAGSAGNNAVTLTDWILLSGGDPTAAAAFLVKKGVSSKGVQSALAKRLSPEATVGLPKAEFGEATIDNYLEFLKKTNGIETPIPKDLGGVPNTQSLRNSKDFIEFPRQTGLSASDKLVEHASIEKYLANREQLKAQYLEQFGKVVNTDLARRSFKDVGYNGKNSAAVQEAASALAKDAYREGLKNKGDDAILYAGGSGTGKSTAVKNLLPTLENEAAVILDGNLSTFGSAWKRIEEAVLAGKDPHIVYVYREPVDAWINGVVKRMNDNVEEGGRIVPMSTFLENHPGSLDVVKRLSNINGVQLTLIDNSLGRGKAAVLSLDKLNKLSYNIDTLRQRLLVETKRLLEDGTITKDQYDALIR